MAGVVYVDTSAIVALLVNEPRSSAVAAWYAASSGPLVSAVWCVPEFASALSMKQRTGHLSAAMADDAWQRFDRLTAADIELLPVDPGAYAHAAALCRKPTPGVRAGDALHLACAQGAGARSIVTLDAVQARAAKSLKIRTIELA